MEGVRLGGVSARDLLPVESQGAAGDGSFAALLQQGYHRLEELQSKSADLTRELVAGKPVELHRVIMAGEQAGLAFELTQAIRNKVVDAYQEVMRMQV